MTTRSRTNVESQGNGRGYLGSRRGAISPRSGLVVVVVVVVAVMVCRLPVQEERSRLIATRSRPARRLDHSSLTPKTIRTGTPPVA
jgi:hypothetical protein